MNKIYTKLYIKEHVKSKPIKIYGRSFEYTFETTEHVFKKTWDNIFEVKLKETNEIILVDACDSKYNFICQVHKYLANDK